MADRNVRTGLVRTHSGDHLCTGLIVKKRKEKKLRKKEKSREKKKTKTKLLNLLDGPGHFRPFPFSCAFLAPTNPPLRS